MSRRRIVLDCDPGIDDALAILCAHRYGELTAITTVCGNVGLVHTTANALAVAQLAGIDVPVHSGAHKPLRGAGPARDAAHVHGATGLGDAELPPVTAAVASDDAIGFLLDAADQSLDLVAVGPLTNLALALSHDPSFLSRWRLVTIMGGAIGGGNATPTAEFNIWADPEAAHAVVRAGGATRVMIPLNLTEQVLCSAAMIGELDAADTPTARFAAHVLRFARRTPALHDPAAVLSVTHPEHFGLSPECVEIELGEGARGQTRASSGDPNTSVGYDVDADAVLRLIADACIDPFRPTG